MYQKASWDSTLRGRYCLYPSQNSHPDLYPCPDPSLYPVTHSIPAFVLLQPSAHLCCNQVPSPAMISIDPPVSAEALIITCGLCIISIGRNKAAMFYPSAPRTWVTGSQPSRKNNSPSSVSICFLPLPITHPCFNIPDPHHPHLTDPRSHDFSGSDYYSSMVSLV